MLPVKKKTNSYIILHTFPYVVCFVNCLAFVDIKQTLHYKVATD